MSQFNPALVLPILITCIAVSAKAIYELVLIVKKTVHGQKPSSVYCNYPSSGGGCAFSSHDFAKMRGVEIIQGVTGNLMPELKEQTKVLRDVLDATRDLKQGIRRQ